MGIGVWGKLTGVDDLLELDGVSLLRADLRLDLEDLREEEKEFS